MPGVCPRCNREVYFAEEKLALGKVWHTFCFSCRNCRKLLNSCNVVTHLGELFCKNCYGRQSHSANDHKTLSEIRLSANSTQNLLRCSCGGESSLGNTLRSRKRHYQSDACRLRGGGSEVGETYVSFDEEKKHFLENECTNLSITNSMSTLCDPPPSPTAVTTWYNRQHSKFRSTSLESEKNNITKDCRFEAQQDIDLSELNPLLSNNEIDIAEAQLSSYDIWRADDPAGKNDGGYENVNVSQTETEGTGRMHFEKSASECCNDAEETLNKCNDIEKNSGPNCTMNEKDDESSREDSMTYQNCPSSSNGLDDSDRMRGGCGGSCTPCGPRPKVSCGVVKVIETACHCGKREPEPCRTVTSCSSCSSPCNERRSCCPPANERPICKKTIMRCRPVCTETQGCGGGGCCGSGCRGGCGKPGQTCMPARPCTTPCRPCSPCSPPRPCPPQSSCSCRKCSPCCSSIGGAANCCGRSKSPACRVSRRRCSTDRGECNEGGCCRPKVICECLGGGLDCQRCGRKVYQAEMQMVSGIPYHNICFSCYCCRKPLEPLTYQENCGEIYCKQCYVRNFGPQGYGYGVGPGTLQTPM
ncbi:uncharacterized protein LOC143208128 isoform X1 [Lasioglossum baleicum]|uniref:uncharacterized protein LOC143208128 isoform X1 n=1 Tax=Lasioglossum baleicum TaxID=434251 RepID=UPI003FCCF3EB